MRYTCDSHLITSLYLRHGRHGNACQSRIGLNSCNEAGFLNPQPLTVMNLSALNSHHQFVALSSFPYMLWVQPFPKHDNQGIHNPLLVNDQFGDYRGLYYLISVGITIIHEPKVLFLTNQYKQEFDNKIYSCRVDGRREAEPKKTYSQQREAASWSLSFPTI